jgi:ABC-type antimicrobial peptide transport system permease subunit
MITKYLLVSFICTTLAFLLINYIAIHLQLLPPRAFGSVIVEAVVVSLVTSFVVAYFLNRKARKRNIK